MQHNYYLVLKHIKEQPGVLYQNIPNNIKAEFELEEFGQGGLYRDLEIVLKEHKNWITGDPTNVRANIAILISILVAALELWKIFKEK